MSRLLVLVSLAALGGCTAGQGAPPQDTDPASLRPTQRLLVWTGGQRYDLHAVTVDADSLRGTRWPSSPACDSCRVTLLRVAVDSARAVEEDDGSAKAGVMLVSVAVIIFIIKVFPRPN